MRFVKGQIPWNKGIKGQIPWNKGKTGAYSEEALEKMRNRHVTKETRLKLSLSHKGQQSAMKGKCHTKEAIEKMKHTFFKKGQIPWIKGKHHTEKTKKKIRGRLHTDEEKEKMKGRYITRETRLKMSLARKGRYDGRNHWNWRGGITPETQKRVETSEWKDLRKQIYKRDNYMCQCCSVQYQDKNGNALTVHHIIPFRISKDNNPNNLKTLCKSCHCKAEWKYNKANPETIKTA